jgi:hypothetical protein
MKTNSKNQEHWIVFLSSLIGVTQTGKPVTQTGNCELPKQADTKETITKETKQKKTLVANATDDDRAIANELLVALLNSNESFRRKFVGDEDELRKKAGGFAEDIEKLRRIDKMPPENIRMMIEWLFNSKHKDAIFWRGNIQSGKALREKFPRLIAAMEREHQDSKSSFLFIS